MLVPILDVAQNWAVPRDARARFSGTHFARRAAERGVTCLPGWALQWVVIESLDRHRSDLIAPVFDLNEGATAYRIILPEGCFYPVVRASGAVMTIYNQEMMRRVRRGRRARFKRTGVRVRG
jgi:hypothetical protein